MFRGTGLLLQLVPDDKRLSRIGKVMRIKIGIFAKRTTRTADSTRCMALLTVDFDWGC